MNDSQQPDQPMNRRSLLKSGAGAAGAMAAAVMLPGTTLAATQTHSHANGNTRNHDSFVTTKDGARIFYKDWGSGQPVVFSHGWPLCADAWDPQMLFLVQHGFRVIAHDRRGHGRSSQTANGNDMDTYADDLAAVMDALDLKNTVMVGHSTGGGEVAHYIGRHGSKRVAKAVLIGAVPPIMLKTANNPEGTPLAVFDGIRTGVAENRSQFYKDLAVPFFGFNRPNAKVSQGLVDEFWREGMEGSALSQYLCIKQFSEVDYTEDLKRIDVPTLIVHGDDDQIVPIAASAQKSARLVKNATLKIYVGAPHGLCATEVDKINADLLAFIKA
ncbi:alpha/beta fold hydrolase [Silvimonas amylolytica]|uniref:Non-heme chloroperoxidase n=1 Tax=Silvimonas amylolytica TaxID=449663 RepID=A0ABQ2PGL8_9NEIS|nr:alpha/beta hydrolase [Silvimonas amylolytica]GGP24397.1 non-heme chloroperoxidase [Silvimonas amylolytica]